MFTNSSPAVTSARSEMKPDLHMKCTECTGSTKIRNTGKSGHGVAKCACGAVFDYSCWEIQRDGDKTMTMHKIEAFLRATRP